MFESVNKMQTISASKQASKQASTKYQENALVIWAFLRFL